MDYAPTRTPRGEFGLLQSRKKAGKIHVRFSGASGGGMAGRVVTACSRKVPREAGPEHVFRGILVGTDRDSVPARIRAHVAGHARSAQEREPGGCRVPCEEGCSRATLSGRD